MVNINHAAFQLTCVTKVQHLTLLTDVTQSGLYHEQWP
jgi:hypothetical protein